MLPPMCETLLHLPRVIDTPMTGEQLANNPLYDGADPWVVRHGDSYFWSNARSDGGIEIWQSHSPFERGLAKIVWTPPRRGWNSHQVWAPELHHINGRWYIYYTASNGRNANHRMGVLRSISDDPQGEYEDLGQLYTGDEIATKSNNRWAIDGTVLQLHGRVYFLWSGWQDERDIQHLYIAEMSDPTAICSNRVQLCPNNCHAWEHVGDDRGQRGLNEGPAILRRNGRVFVIYSASGSWQHSYKLGMLWMDACADPMNPASWTKHNEPVFESTDEVCGVGHCSFTTTRDGQDVMLYHAKKSRRDGWERRVHAQLFDWDEDGMPNFGEPLTPGEPIVPPTRTTPQRKAA
jgi:GH43 family beta-xylosidase